MKLLHLGLMVNEDKDIGLSHAFREKIEHYEEVKIDQNVFDRVNSLQFDPDIIFVQIQNEKIHQRHSVHLGEIVGKKWPDSFVINFTGDKRRMPPQWMKQFSSDLICFSNWDDVNITRDTWRCKADFLQIGIDPEVFHRNWFKEVSFSTPEIVFMGNHAGHFPLSKFRMEAVKQLKKRYGHRFAVYGNGYPTDRGNLNADPRNPNENQIREAFIYSQAKIGISISHFNSQGYFSDRLLRIMGSGCCALSHNFPGSDEMFNKSLIVRFNTIPDMIKEIDYLLDDDENRKEIANNGYNYVHANHTYSNMVDDILNLWKKWK